MARKPRDTRNLEKRGGVWYVTKMVEGKRIVQSTGETDLLKAQAERDRVLALVNIKNEKERTNLLAARLATVDEQLQKIEDELPALTVKHAWAAFLECGKRLERGKRLKCGESTLAQYEQTYEQFAAWIVNHHPAVVELRQVNFKIAEQYAQHIVNGISGGTFNRKLAALQMVWRILADEAKLADNPWSRIERLEIVQHGRRELTLDELRRVCAAAEGEMRTLLATGLFGGLRLVDAALLDWSSIDLTRGMLIVTPRKTARRKKRDKQVEIPIHPAWMNLLLETPPDQRTGYVMPTMAERYQQYNNALSSDVGKLFQRCGITISTRPEAGMRARPETGFHSLRHAFASIMAREGTPPTIIKSLTGHGSLEMVDKYAHSNLEAQQRAIAALPNVLDVNTLPEAESASGAPVEALKAILAGMDKEALALAAKLVKAEQKRRA